MERHEEDLLDLAALARHLGISQRSTRRMVSEGRLPPPVRYGGLVRWRWGVVRDWQRAMEVLDRLPGVAEAWPNPAKPGQSGTNAPGDDSGSSEVKKRR